MADDIVPLRDFQRTYVLGILERLEGNRAGTAEALKISLRGLQYMLRRWQSEGYKIPSKPLGVPGRPLTLALLLVIAVAGTAWSHGSGPSGGAPGGAPAGAPAGGAPGGTGSAPGGTAGPSGGTTGGAGETPVVRFGALAGPRESVPVVACLFGVCRTFWRIPKAQAAVLDAHHACSGGRVVLEQVTSAGRFSYRADGPDEARYRECLTARGFVFGR